MGVLEKCGLYLILLALSEAGEDFEFFIQPHIIAVPPVIEAQARLIDIAAITQDIKGKLDLIVRPSRELLWPDMNPQLGNLKAT